MNDNSLGYLLQKPIEKRTQHVKIPKISAKSIIQNKQKSAFSLKKEINLLPMSLNIKKNEYKDLNQYQYESDGYNNDENLNINTKYKCLMNDKGCTQKFYSKKEVYLHLILNCEYFICNKCKQNEEIQIKEKTSKQSVTKRNISSSQGFDSNIKFKIVKSEGFSLTSIKQRYFYNYQVDSVLSLSHKDNLYKNFNIFDDNYEMMDNNSITSTDKKSIVSKMKERCFGKYNINAYKNYDNIVEYMFNNNQIEEMNNNNNTSFTSLIFSPYDNKAETAGGKVDKIPIRNNKKHSPIRKTIINDFQILNLLTKDNKYYSRNRDSHIVETSIPRDFSNNKKQILLPRLLSSENKSVKFTTSFKNYSKNASNFSIKTEYTCDSPILSYDILKIYGFIITGNEDGYLYLFNVESELGLNKTISKSTRRLMTSKYLEKSDFPHENEVITVKFINKSSKEYMSKLNKIDKYLIFSLLSIDRNSKIRLSRLYINHNDMSLKIILISQIKNEYEANLIKSIKIINDEYETKSDPFNFSILFGLANGDLSECSYKNQYKNKSIDDKKTSKSITKRKSYKNKYDDHIINEILINDIENNIQLDEEKKKNNSSFEIKHDDSNFYINKIKNSSFKKNKDSNSNNSLFKKYIFHKHSISFICFFPDSHLLITSPQFSYKRSICIWEIDKENTNLYKINGISDFQIEENNEIQKNEKENLSNDVFKLRINQISKINNSFLMILYNNDYIKIYDIMKRRHISDIFFSFIKNTLWNKKVLCLNSVFLNEKLNLICGLHSKEMIITNINEILEKNYDDSKVIRINISNDESIDKIYNLRNLPYKIYTYMKDAVMNYVVIEKFKSSFIGYLNYDV